MRVLSGIEGSYIVKWMLETVLGTPNGEYRIQETEDRPQTENG